MTAALGAVMEVRADRDEAPMPVPLPLVLPLVEEPPLLPCSAALVVAVPSAFWADDSAVPMHIPEGRRVLGGARVSAWVKVQAQGRAAPAHPPLPLHPRTGGAVAGRDGVHVSGVTRCGAGGGLLLGQAAQVCRGE